MVTNGDVISNLQCHLATAIFGRSIENASNSEAVDATREIYFDTNKKPEGAVLLRV